MPTWLPSRLLDQAEQRDFLSGVQPYVADLQQQVASGITGLTQTAKEMARQAMSPAITGAPSPLPGLDSGGDRGYLDPATPAPSPVPSADNALPPPAPSPAPPPSPPPSAIQPFTLPSFASLTAPTTAAPAPSPPSGAAAQATTSPSPFSLPSWQELTGLAEPVRQAAAAGVSGLTAPDPAPARAPGGAGLPPASGAAAPGPAPTDVNGYLAYAARKAGIDPAQVLAVMGKEGPTGWGSVGRFNTGTSYGPLQLHYAGGSDPQEGMGDRFTRATGIDLRTDSSLAAHQAAVDFAMQDLLKDGDWHQWYGADNAFPAASGGKGRFTPVARVAPQQATAASAAPPTGTYTKDALVPNQITEGAAQGLTSAEALAVCGPAAAVAFARANGRNPTLREAKELASSLGLWDVGAGMHGPATQVQLLEKMGVPATLQQGADWGRVAAEVQRGKPVIIDTPNHYFVASDFDPATGTFDFGQSAGVLRAAKGRTRFRPEELPSLGMGAPRATIYMAGGG